MIARIVFASLMASTALVAIAQNYPVRPIRIVVATGPGSPDDVNTRMLATKLSESFGQQVITENRPGAAGLIGHASVANAKPDGYTLLYAGGSMAGSRYVNAAYHLDVLRDFAPISLLATGRFMLAVTPSIPARTLREFIDLARRHPGKITYVTAGLGQTPYWNSHLLNQMAGIKAVEVAYKTSSEAVVDLIAGRVDYFFIGSAMAVTNKAKLRLLGVSTATRSPAFPEVPTIAEAALPGYDMPAWGSLMGPAGMPREIVNTLNAAVVRAMALPDVRERLARLGADPFVLPTDTFNAFIRAEIESAAAIARAANLKAN